MTPLALRGLTPIKGSLAQQGKGIFTFKTDPLAAPLLASFPNMVASKMECRHQSSYDIFKKLKDPPEESYEAGKARKPSAKVIKLVDEIMNLTLIEAADLCDLCQETLAERGGGPTFHAAAMAGRAPFPHPSSMFAGMIQPGMGHPGMMMAGTPMAPMPGNAAAPPTEAAAAPAQEKKVEEKTSFTIRLVSFDAPKKVAVVKEVRAITALGLKESKELVEQAPKIIKKAVPAAEAQAFKQKLEAAGATIALE